MTARKPNSRTRGASKAAKTIDLTAEDVTKRDAPETAASPESSEVSKSSGSPKSPEPSESTTTSEATPKPKSASDAPLDDPVKDDGDKDATVTLDDPKSEPPQPDDIVAAYAKAEAAAEAEAKLTVQSEDTAPSEDDAGSKDEISPDETEPTEASSPPPVAGMMDKPKSGFGGGFAGGLLGGVAIVALGYLGLQQGLITVPGDEVRLVAQDEQLSALKSDVAFLKNQIAEVPRIDVTSLEAQIESAKTDIAAVNDRLEALLNPTTDTAAEAPVNEQVTNAALANLAQRIEDLEALKGQFEAAQASLAKLEAQALAQTALIGTKTAELNSKLDQSIAEAKNDILSSADRRINDVVTDLSNFQDKVSGDTEQITNRVASLEQNNLSEKMQSSARTIALAGLENAVASGADYSLALATFADVVGEHDGVTILKDYADTGAPTREQLAANFRNVYENVLREAKDAGAATLLDRFLLNAQSLVKVKSLSGESKGESLTSQLGVVEYHAEKGDLVKALEAWNALPPEARDAEAGADWLKGLKARIAVDAAMKDIRAEFGTDAMANAS